MSEQQTCRASAAWQNVVDCWRHSASPKPLPLSASSIPHTSPQRLAEAAQPTLEKGDTPRSNTHLYLAYGSNLAAETFLGRRGIRPLSAVNVSVPTLDLSFDLPGLPYWEPCFANVTFRKLPEKPKLPDPSHPPHLPPVPPIKPPPQAEADWNGGLVGVVYEVTEEDYNTIIRTEGGGASYKQIVVPCIPIPPRFSTPEKPPIPELPRPFMAQTLFAPYVPDADLPDDPRKDKWWYRFVVPVHRPAPNYAQASARYLKLLTDGAKEHDLPEEYQQYMHSLQSYRVTSLRQKIGKLLFMAVLLPIAFLMLVVVPLIVGKKAQLPPWLAVTSTVLFNLVWMTYDKIFEPHFGDGERTTPKKKGFQVEHGSLQDEENAALLGQ